MGPRIMWSRSPVRIRGWDVGINAISSRREFNLEPLKIYVHLSGRCIKGNDAIRALNFFVLFFNNTISALLSANPSERPLFHCEFNYVFASGN